MEETTTTISLMERLHIFDISKAIVILVVGYLLAKLASTAVSRVNFANLTAHGKVQLKRAVFYLIFILMFISALRELGFDLSVLVLFIGLQFANFLMGDLIGPVWHQL